MRRDLANKIVDYLKNTRNGTTLYNMLNVLINTYFKLIN